MFTPPPSPRPIPVDTGSLTLESEASSSSRGRQSLSPDVSDRLSPSPSRSHREKRPPSIILTPPDEDMVSPLPSPLPALVVSSKEIPLSLSPAEKKRIGARTRLVSLVLVPLVLILITYTTRALSHPIALDIFSPSSEASWSSASDWSIHKRHPSPDSGSGSGQNSSTSLLFPTGGSATPTTTAASSTNSGGSALVPTVPADAPVLPTPFPQALDTTLGQNFTTKNCQDFFANMTQSVAFRSCRPLSLLIHSSSAFIDAQSNLTLYNDLIWGTCNTRTDVDQCNTNIDWFRDTLQSACATELSGRNALATTTLTGLQAYSLMRQAGCLVNPSTNTYCLLDAVRATTASDIYYYGLPLGTPLPAGMTPTCSACSKSLLSLFAPSAKVNGASGNTTATLPALGNGVYSRAASVANAQCGQEFAVGASNGGNSVSRPASWLMALTTLVVAIIAL